MKSEKQIREGIVSAQSNEDDLVVDVLKWVLGESEELPESENYMVDEDDYSDDGNDGEEDEEDEDEE